MKPSSGSLAVRACSLALFSLFLFHASPAQAAVRRAAPASPVVIEVNGIKITRDAFEKRAMREMRRQVMQMGVTETMLMAPEMAKFRLEFESKVADALISRLVLLTAAQKARHTVSKDSMQSAWHNVIRSFPSDEAMSEAFKKDGESMESVMKEIKAQLSGDQAPRHF
ncbi:MAG: SurA N-terminal domain-containing protein, partial [Candidatus Hydrogenedentota bacterium]